jgi:hypothetical protein
MRTQTKGYVGKHRNQILFRVGENLYRSKQSKRYYAVFERCGQQYRRSLRTTDRRLAERRLADLRVQIGNLKADASTRDIGFIEYAKQWVELHGASLKPASKKRRQTAINSLTPYFAKMRLRSIVKLDVEEWRAKRLKEVSPKTVVIELETLKMIFNHAVEAGVLLTKEMRVETALPHASEAGRKWKVEFPSKPIFGVMDGSQSTNLPSLPLPKPPDTSSPTFPHPLSR